MTIKKKTIRGQLNLQQEQFPVRDEAEAPLRWAGENERTRKGRQHGCLFWKAWNTGGETARVTIGVKGEFLSCVGRR